MARTKRWIWTDLASGIAQVKLSSWKYFGDFVIRIEHTKGRVRYGPQYRSLFVWWQFKHDIFTSRGKIARAPTWFDFESEALGYIKQQRGHHPMRIERYVVIT
jgi:hypothetical protein